MGATAFSYDYSFRQLILERKDENSAASLLRHPQLQVQHQSQPGINSPKRRLIQSTRQFR